jgi:ATP-dependent Zn protease
MENSVDPKLRKTAYHEAGHAVAAHELEVKIGQISIIPDDSYGRVLTNFLVSNPDVDKTDKNRIQMEKNVMIYFAGFIAEKLYDEKSNITYSKYDIHLAEEHLDFFVSSNEELQKYIDYLWVRTINLFTPMVWAKTSFLVRELLMRKRLSGKETKEAISIAVQKFIMGKRQKREQHKNSEDAKNSSDILVKIKLRIISIFRF